MEVREEKVLLSADRYERVAIARRADGLFCLYQHWHLSPETQRSLGVDPVEDRRWTADRDPTLYDNVEPLPGIYSTIEDAEREARRLIGDDETVEGLRERHSEALRRLQQARSDGDKAQARAWEAVFKRISAHRYKAGDDLNAPFDGS